MPTIEFSKSDLEKLLNKKIDNLETFFLPVKGEVDGYENEIIKLDEKDSNRPDLWSVEGIARELKAHYGIETGIIKYNFNKSDYKVTIKSKTRPIAAYAIAKNINITDDLLKSIIQMQEKITTSFGRRRKEVAIGIFDLDKIEGKNLTYYDENPNFKFSPLGFDEEMSLKEILEKHPKGKEFGHLLKNFDKYPLLIDENNNVLSMPPIINSNHSGKVTLETKNLFIDVTGYDFEKVNTALLIICLALADRGAEVFYVETHYLNDKMNNQKLYTPLIEEKELTFDKQMVYDYFEKLPDDKIIDLLERKRYNATINNGKITVKYLNYRQDILHPVDVIEDILISYGFNKIKPESLNVLTTGKLLDSTEWENLVREAALGFNLQEVMLFTLTSKEKQYKNILTTGNPVEIANPMSEKIAIFREKIFPEHLEFLSSNQHISYPQNIFEVGKILSTDGKKVFEKTKLTVTLCHNKTNYTEIKQYLEGILKNIGATEIKFEEKDYNWFIPGRSAKVTFKIYGIKKTGFLGEVHPQVLENFKLQMPTSLFEIEIDKK